MALVSHGDERLSQLQHGHRWCNDPRVITGAVSIGDINSGGNAGSAIGVGDTWGGPVFVDGGSIGNLTDLGITANGGTAIADASGGDYNLAFVS
jgi:hypothetical protein